MNLFTNKNKQASKQAFIRTYMNRWAEEGGEKEIEHDRAIITNNKCIYIYICIRCQPLRS